MRKLLFLFALLTATLAFCGVAAAAVVNFSAVDQNGAPVAGVCWSVSYFDTITNQTGTASTCTTSLGTNNIAFGAQVINITPTLTSTPAGCTVTSGTINVVLNCTNTPPGGTLAAADDVYTVPTNGTLTGNLLSNDSYDPAMSRVVVDIQTCVAASGCGVVNNDGSFTYTPKTNFTGTVCMRYHIENTVTGARSGTALVSIGVGGSADTAYCAEALSATPPPSGLPTKNPAPGTGAVTMPPGSVTGGGVASGNTTDEPARGLKRKKFFG